jgi:hypothetical protein
MTNSSNILEISKLTEQLRAINYSLDNYHLRNSRRKANTVITDNEKIFYETEIKRIKAKLILLGVNPNE